jgi:hypothetical protein
MRFCSTVCAVVGSVAPLVTAGELTADEIMQRLWAAECARERSLREYSVTRRYAVENEKGTRTAEATAKIDFHADRGKTYQILNENGSDFMFRRAIRKVLDGEVDTSKNDRADIRLTTENYAFQLLGTEQKDGRQCYIIDLHPKRKSKYLIDGRIWVDTSEFALVRLKGRPAASLSFWVGKPLIVQTYQKVGDYWLLSTTKSIADCRFIGKAEMNIEASDFDFPGVPRVTVARRGAAAAPKASID